MANGQPPLLDWRGDVPVARAFDDPYFSLQDGWAETRHTFLAANDLPDRFVHGFQIAELGFGTGLNAAAALFAWKEAGIDTPLTFTSFELHPLDADTMRRALSRWPELLAAAQPILEMREKGEVRCETAHLALQLVVGDARETLPHWSGKADAWFLDGFAPARNPELWEPTLLAEVAKHTKPSGTATTYSAAGAIRRALSDAGFDVARRQGFGRKRHMTVAWLGQSCAAAGSDDGSGDVIPTDGASMIVPTGSSGEQAS